MDIVYKILFDIELLFVCVFIIGRVRKWIGNYV